MATVEELIKQYETDPELQKDIEDILTRADPNNMTPIEALQLVADLKKRTENK